MPTTPAIVTTRGPADVSDTALRADACSCSCHAPATPAIHPEHMEVLRSMLARCHAARLYASADALDAAIAALGGAMPTVVLDDDKAAVSP
jgi:hypothetical protein